MEEVDNTVGKCVPEGNICAFASEFVAETWPMSVNLLFICFLDIVEY